MFVDILKNKFKVIVGLVFILWFLISCQKDYERSYKEGHKIFKEKDLSLMEDAVRNFEESLFFALESIESKYLVLKYLGIKLAEERNI